MTPIIDAHHHIWPQTDLPWLNGPMQPRIFGPYQSIMRDYLIDEYRNDCASSGVTRSVYVQANWAPDRFEDEVAWVQRVGEEHGLVSGIVGYADMTVDDVRPQLDRLARYSMMRGIRQQLHWHENPMYAFAKVPDLALDERVQRNIAHLADYQWSFDLQVFAAQMHGATKLAAACPDVTFILQHAGMLEDTSEASWALWRTNMQRLASQPNVVTKLSAFGTFLHRNDPAFIADMITETVKIFGVERCVYGSNFPIEKIWTDYASLLSAFLAGSASLGISAQRKIFNDNAARLYRLPMN